MSDENATKNTSDPQELPIRKDQPRPSSTTEYRTWAAMLNRCYCETSSSFPRYGGRGITVCERWRKSFSNFIADMGKRPTSKHSIDRIDNNGNYEPSNCRWATRKEQARNTRATQRIVVSGELRKRADVAEENGMSPKILALRLLNGMSVEQAISKPSKSVLKNHRMVSFSLPDDVLAIVRQVQDQLAAEQGRATQTAAIEKMLRAGYLEIMNNEH